jgi:hypothetical protein
MHLLNYDPGPARDVPVSLTLPGEGDAPWKRARLMCYRAGGELPSPLPAEIRGDRLLFTVAEVRVYAAALAELG